MNPAEILAVHVVEQVFAGVFVELHDTGSAPGQYDFKLLRDGSQFGALEVTSDIVEFAANLRAILERKDHRLPPATVQDTWIISVRSRTVSTKWLKKLESTCGKLLAKLEQAGVERFFFNTDYQRKEVLALGDMGVEHGAIVAHGNPGIIVTEFTADPWIVQPKHALDALHRAASQMDNIQKLRSSKVEERHIFVWLDAATSPAGWSALNDTIPVGVPDLPNGITHGWIAAYTRDNEILCWLWDGVRWAVLGPFRPPR